TATAASIALPPALRTSTPTSVACGSTVTTIAFRARTGWRAAERSPGRSNSSDKARHTTRRIISILPQIAARSRSLPRLLYDKLLAEVSMRGLAIGLLLSACLQAQIRYARVGELAGMVEIRLPPAEPWQVALRNAPVREASWIQTGAGAHAEIEL